jgi:16S rRNA processing protein RimM
MIPQGEFPFPAKLKTVRLLPKTGDPAVYTVKSVREIHNAYLLTLNEVSGRNEAQALKGARVQIPQSVLPLLVKGEYYLFELVGSTLHDSAGERLGQIEELLDNAGQILLRILHDGEERFLPAVPETILSFDREKKELLVKVPDGLWEDL